MIPDRGLYTGIAIFGAFGSGKTSGCMYPFAKQIRGYRATDPARKASALVLEVKGDFCYKVQAILDIHGREKDYLEIGLESGYRYNPLHNDLEAYALAYGIASLLNNLFGRGKEPFWQQAYTNLASFRWPNWSGVGPRRHELSCALADLHCGKVEGQCPPRYT